jgi:15-cis-phytoene synthase
MVNATPDPALAAPRMLALAYASAEVRDAFRWLLLFDQRLQEVVERTREPLITQMRLAWWRDMLAKPAGARATGEPLLAALADAEHGGVAIADAALLLVQATEAAVVQNPPGSSAQLRLAAIIRAYSAWSNLDEHDRKFSEKLALLSSEGSGGAMTSSSRRLRPISILVLASQLDCGASKAGPFGPGARLVWHALTGR